MHIEVRKVRKAAPKMASPKNTTMRSFNRTAPDIVSFYRHRWFRPNILNLRNVFKHFPTWAPISIRMSRPAESNDVRPLKINNIYKINNWPFAEIVQQLIYLICAIKRLVEFIRTTVTGKSMKCNFSVLIIKKSYL